MATTEAKAQDNLPVVELLDRRVDGGVTVLRGTAFVANGGLRVRLVDATGSETHSEALRLSGEHRQRWEVSFALPPPTVNVEISPGNTQAYGADTTIVLPI
jgi:hypothetical protein